MIIIGMKMFFKAWVTHVTRVKQDVFHPFSRTVPLEQACVKHHSDDTAGL